VGKAVSHSLCTLCGMSKKRNFLIRHLDEPVHRDWIFWLWIIMTGLSVLGSVNSQSSNLSGSPDLVSGLIDGLILVLSQWLVFNLLPVSIRRKVRSRRT
jgi:hypothetical protein